MQTNLDHVIQSYFTDMDRPRAMFKEFVAAEKLPKRLIVFHGVGGVGKSSLLRMFRLHCKGEKIPVALASAMTQKLNSEKGLAARIKPGLASFANPGIFWRMQAVNFVR